MSLFYCILYSLHRSLEESFSIVYDCGSYQVVCLNFWRRAARYASIVSIDYTSKYFYLRQSMRETLVWKNNVYKRKQAVTLVWCWSYIVYVTLKLIFIFYHVMSLDYGKYELVYFELIYKGRELAVKDERNK